MNKIFTGVILITIGILWLLSSLNVISFLWCDILRLWPIIFVWIGVCFLPIPEIYRLIINVLSLVLCLYLLFSSNKMVKADRCITFEHNHSTEFSIEGCDSVLTDSRASLHFSAGAGVFSFDTTTLLMASGSKGLAITVKRDTINSSLFVTAETIDRMRTLHVGDFRVNLNPNPLWTMNLEMGACSGKLNLAPFRIEKLKLESGASDLTVRLGDKYPEVHADISVGASSLAIEIPKTMRCVIAKEAALSNISFYNFTEKNGTFVAEAETTPSQGVIYLSIESGVARIDIKRY